MEPKAPHRKRCKRWDILWSAHFLTFSCFKRQPFLAKDRPIGWFLDSIRRARHEHPFDLWGFVIMPEHAHLLIWPHEGVKISPLLKSLKQPVSQKAVHWVEQHTPHLLPKMLDLQPNGRQTHRFWQRGGGHDRNMRTTSEIHEKLHYIHNNPVKRELVKAPEDWPWSSARAWLTGEDEPLRIDRDSFPLLVT
jgi:putative transposase